MPGVYSGMRRNPVQHIFFFALLLLTTLVFWNLIEGLVMPLFWAAVLAVLFRPVRKRWLELMPGWYSLAALLTVITVVLTVVLPVTAVGIAMVNEVTNLYAMYQAGEIDPSTALSYIERVMPQVVEFVQQFGVDVAQLNQRISEFAVTASQYLATQAVSFGQSAIQTTALFFLMLYLLFFFVRDGNEIVEGIIRVLPLGDERERRLFAKFAEVARATIKGTLVVAVVQGALGGLMFWILGITAPVFWGVVMTVLSILPAIGSAVVWLPAAIILIATGEIVKGIVLIAFGTLVIGLVDNILRPILVGRDTQMPDYMILLATLGGLTVFGITGFIIGPVVAALFLVLWGMFQEEYSQEETPEQIRAVKEATEKPHHERAEQSRHEPDEPPQEDVVTREEL